MKTVLIVAAHGDDEVLGCGGTMARHIEKGDDVHVLLLADGVTSRDVNADTEARKMSSLNAAQVLGVQVPIFKQFPDNRLDTVPLLDVVQEIENVVGRVQPDVIYTHHAGDLNVDHVIAHRAVMTACRPEPGRSVRVIYGFEVLSSTEWSGPDQSKSFVPVHFVEISKTMNKKLDALTCYSQEMRPFPHARSFEAVKSLACLRGCQVGVEAAEAFTVLRQIDSD